MSRRYFSILNKNYISCDYLFLNYLQQKKVFSFLKNKLNENSVFFDDNDHMLNSISRLTNFKVVDAKLIDDWRNLIGHYN